MKLIIDIPKATYDYWKEHKDEYVLSEAIANAIPYDDSGDLISRSELMRAIGTMVEAEMPIDEKWALGLKHSLKVIDNAPTATLPNEQNAWEQGYECGYHQAKDDAIRRIAEQYSKHNELVPYWLSIGDMKGDKE